MFSLLPHLWWNNVVYYWEFGQQKVGLFLDVTLGLLLFSHCLETNWQTRKLQIFHSNVGIHCTVVRTAAEKVKPGPHQQQRRSNIVECYKVERCFDIVVSVDRA